jgi:hypothetical protein
MQTVADNTNTGAAQKVTAVIAQQHRLLKRFEGVSHYLSGVAAGMYLPGIDQTFDNATRRITGRRPPLLTLEAETLNFTGAISRPQNNRLVYTPIFSYDLTIPYTPRGGGRALPANNIVLARRANELLANLVAYGQRVSFGVHEALPVFEFPTVVRDVRGAIVAEDYAPVLGFELDNPAKTLDVVSVQKSSPAAKILARHGIEYPLSVGAVELDNLVTEFRAEFAGVEIEWAAAVDALLFRRDYVSFTLSRDEAIEVAPAAVVLAMRQALPPKYQWEASFNDLIAAARNPNSPLRISRLSAVQLFPVESVYDMSEDYAGTVLSPVDWTPPPPSGGSVPFSVSPRPDAPSDVTASKTA